MVGGACVTEEIFPGYKFSTTSYLCSLLQDKVTKDQSWADIPTCKESGIDVEYQMLRAFFLPAGTTKDQVAFYADLLKKVIATPEWKEYVAKQALKETYLTGQEFVKFLEKDEAFHNKLMHEAGFASKK